MAAPIRTPVSSLKGYEGQLIVMLRSLFPEERTSKLRRGARVKWQPAWDRKYPPKGAVSARVILLNRFQGNFMSRASLSFFLGVSLLACGSISAQINIINVTSVAELKAAINTANSNGKDDIINLATNTYTLSAVDNLTMGANGLPVIGTDGNHSVTIHGHGSTITRSGSTPFRILQCAESSRVFIDDLTISNGLIALFAAGNSIGAGIFNNGGTLTVTTCTFNSNSVQGTPGGDGISVEPNGNNGDSAAGGAIGSSGALTASGCAFTNNSAGGGKGGNGFNGGSGGSGGNGGSGEGGAIALGPGANIIRSCTFTGNAAANGAFGQGHGNHDSGYSGLADGGAISMGGTATVNLCTFTNNIANGYSPGGFYSYPSTGGAINSPGGPFYPVDAFKVTESAFSNNHADYGGAVVGGIFSGCTFESNGANYAGGAVASMGSGSFIGSFDYQNTTTIDCTFYSNIAGDGGAVYSNGIGNSTVTNCTLVSNTALSVAGSVDGGTLTNSIFKGGSPTNFATGTGVGIASNGHNISDDAATGDGGTGPGGMLNQTGDVRNTNPQLLTTSPQDNGGPTRTFAIGLFGAGPAINAGDDGYAPHRDQRGYFRTGRSDIGAFEYSGGVVGSDTIARNGNDAVISAEVIYGHSYQLERKMNLSDASWQPIGSEFTATDNDIEPAPTASGDLSLVRAFYHVRFTN
jgi:hypothetical protein